MQVCVGGKADISISESSTSLDANDVNEKWQCEGREFQRIREWKPFQEYPGASPRAHDSYLGLLSFQHAHQSRLITSVSPGTMYVRQGVTRLHLALLPGKVKSSPTLKIDYNHPRVF